MAVAAAIQFCLVAPSHLKIIFADEVLRIGKSCIACKYCVTTQVNEVLVFPEYPHGYSVYYSLDELLRFMKFLLRLFALDYVGNLARNGVEESKIIVIVHIFLSGNAEEPKRQLPLKQFLTALLSRRARVNQ